MPQKPPAPSRHPARRRRTPKSQTAPLPVVDPTPPPGPGHLPPRTRETTAEHRAFLLWAMMAPDRRSYRAVSRAVDVGDITIRRWSAKHGWLDRVKVEASDRLAWQEYVGRYAGVYGVRGIALIQPAMDFPGPLTPLAMLRSRLGQGADAAAYPRDSAARLALETAAEVSRQVMGDQIHDPHPLAGDQEPDDVELLDDQELDQDLEDEDPNLPPSPLAGNPGQGKGGQGGGGRPRPGEGQPAAGHGRQRSSTSRSSAPPERDSGSTDDAAASSAASPPAGDAPGDAADDADPAARRSRVDDYRTLIKASLGVYARDLTAKDRRVKVTPRDAVLLIELEQALAEAPQQVVGSGPVDSVRVRLAREQGEDVLAAIEQDHQELGVLLQALRQKREQDVAHLRQELAMRAQVVPMRDEEVA